MNYTTSALRGQARKSLDDVYAGSKIISQNVRMLMARYQDTQERLAAFCGITDRTLRARMERPWEFRWSELEDIARRYDCTVTQLARPMRFADDDE